MIVGSCEMIWETTQIGQKTVKICPFLYINKGRLNPFKCSEMIGNYKGKMLDEVSRLEDDLQPLEDDLQTTEDDLQTQEDDLNIMEDYQKIFPFN